MESSVIWLSLVPLYVGYVVTVFGLCGRKLDDHPFCRKCGFDLFGSPDDAPRCPECGQELTDRTLGHGRRQRRKGAVIAGLLVMLVSVGLGGGAMWASLNQTDWQQYKPTWLLVLELDSAGSRADALEELSTRFKSLNQSTLNAIADAGLELQADPDAEWMPEYGDFIQAAHAEDKLDNARWRRYLEQAVFVEIELRPRVRLGDRLPTKVARSFRVGNTAFALRKSNLAVTPPPMNYRVRVQPQRVRLAGSELKMHSSSTSSMNNDGNSWSSSSHNIDALRDGTLPTGEHPVEIDIKITVLTGNNEPVHTWEQTLTDTVEIVPADTETVELVKDESLREAVEAAVTLEELTIEQWGDRPSFSLNLDIKPRPVGLACQAFIRSDGNEWKLSSLSQAADSGTNYGLSGDVPEGYDGGNVDIILRPDVDRALTTTDVFTLWGHDIVFEDVPVKDERPTAEGGGPRR